MGNQSVLRAVLIGVTVLILAGFGGYAIYHTLNEEAEKDPPPTPVACEQFEDLEGRTVLPVGSQAYPFTLTSMDGKRVTLKDYLGKGRVLVEIFATWCPHCQESVPAVKEIQKAFADELTVVAINAGDPPTEPSTSRQFQEEYHVTYPILERPDKAFIDGFCLTSFPTFYLLDESGTVIWRMVGTMDGEHLQELKSRLAEG
jgi:thiol-disulfide isomerase/thioredoxin